MCYFYLFLAFSQSQPICCLQRNTLTRRWQRQRKRAVSAVPEENEAAAEQVSKAPHHQACSSLDIAFEETLQERQSQGWSVSTTSSETQVQTYLSEKTPLRKATHFSTGKNMLISFPLWLRLQPSILVPPAALWTVRDFLVPLQTSLMRTETGSNLTR